MKLRHRTPEKFAFSNLYAGCSEPIRARLTFLPVLGCSDWDHADTTGRLGGDRAGLVAELSIANVELVGRARRRPPIFSRSIVRLGLGSVLAQDS